MFCTIPEVKFRHKDFSKSKVSLLAIPCEDWFNRSTEERVSRTEDIVEEISDNTSLYFLKLLDNRNKRIPV